MTLNRAAILLALTVAALWSAGGVSGAPDEPPGVGRPSLRQIAVTILRGTKSEIDALVPHVASLDAPSLRLLFVELRAREAVAPKEGAGQDRGANESAPAGAHSRWELERTRQLVSRLGDPSPAVVHEVVEELGLFQDSRAAQALLEIYDRTTGVRLREKIIWALEMMRAVDAVPTLIHELASDHLWVRYLAEVALFRITGQRYDSLRSWIEQGPLKPPQRFYRKWFRENEADLRRKLRQPRRDSSLPEESKSSTGGRFAKLAERVLGESASGRADAATEVEAMTRTELSQILTALRAHADGGSPGEMSSGVVYRLPSERDRDGRLRLWASRLMSEDVGVASVATVKLRLLKDIRAAKHLVDAIERTKRDRDSRVRSGAICALEALKAVDGVPSLIELLTEVDRGRGSVRASAYEALVTITNKKFKFSARGSGASRQATQRKYRTWFKANERRLRKKFGQEKK